MSATDGAAVIERHGNPAVMTRVIGWATIGALVALLIDNVLIVGFGFSPPLNLFSGDLSAALPLAVYLLFMGIGTVHVLRSRDISLRWDADLIYRANSYIIRGVYFGVFMVGIADIAISFMRVEHIFSLVMSETYWRLFERPDFVGKYIHIPLLILGFVWAKYSNSLGFIWLSLLIIIAELSIVITRFVFSYEQAFMGDLVRYWYSALFLLASAYTLYREGHVRVDILYSGLGARTKGKFNTWGIILFGMPTAWTILLVGFAGKHSIINGPVMNFEVTQTGGIGLYVKYQMAAFLGVFAATMLIQFVSALFDVVADGRGEPGHRENEAVAQ